MESFAKMNPALRQGLLALIMLVVLLAATATAWLVSSRPALEPGETWYVLADADGGLIGWEVRHRGPGGPLDRQGYNILALRDAQPIWSRWTLNEAATRGRYLSESPLMTNRGPGKRRTSIELNGDLIQVDQVIAVGERGARTSATFAVPPAYAPEGTLYPRIAEAARSGKSELITYVDDETRAMVLRQLTPVGTRSRDVDGRQMLLTVVRLERPPADAEIGPSLELPEGPEGDESAEPLPEPTEDSFLRFYVDRDGQVVIREDVTRGKVAATLTVTSIEAILRRFPSAASVRNRILRESDWN